ncbi:nuclear transport factor 2 family protein [Marivirga sp. S37H4]|uniref:Nuclear transport factor 2 family protein n=1 Tax=Marivirga aurantiaca TaxID=2802615 RepID=A0A934WXZ3_9BACT|nr:nuclear transport factor 2 family protein [Marivirga aurantiaca]MBK6265233.1 nuclear transport factor 2 family protein [Marivirga aurantiaca]
MKPSIQIKYILMIIGLLSLASSPVKAQSKSAIAKIDSVRMAMQELARKNELYKVAEFYTQDAIVNGSDGSLSGMDEIKNYWENLRGEGVDWHWEKLEYSGVEDYVTQTGLSLLTLQYGERKITYHSTFSVVWEKQADGNYKIVSDFYRIAPKQDLK